MDQNWDLRAKWHDYRRPSVYHITLKKAPGVPAFAKIIGNPHAKYGDRDYPKPDYSPLGFLIWSALKSFPGFNKIVNMQQYAIMPDHVHMLIHIKEPIPDHFGNIMAAFKASITRAARQRGLIKLDESVFLPSFNDQIILPGNDFDPYYRYIRENPRRLLVRQTVPGFFRRINETFYKGKKFQFYGNLQLLSIPFKKQVVVHRKDTEADFKSLSERCRHLGLNGGVLVSPFISAKEKEIMKEAMHYDGRIILVRGLPLKEREKPGGELFRLCEEGKLLIAVPLEREIQKDLSRADCLYLNDSASMIAETLEPA